jgi:hypothetical protein
MEATTGRTFRARPSAALQPELNPIERVWKLTRRRGLHNRYFSQLDEVILTIEAEFANLD